MEENTNILEKIHASYYQLTATERRVADYVLGNSTQVQFMSITQLAEECNTTEASVSRFCRRLKLKGFNAFKIEFATHIATTSVSKLVGHQEVDSESLEGRCHKVACLSQEAVNHTIELIQKKDIYQSVEAIEKAGRVLCMGAGGSTIIADECTHLFSTVTCKFLSVSDSHLQMSAVATMDPEKDIIILFSYSGATQSGVEVLKLAKARNVTSILITRFPKSPAAKLATIILRCGSSEGPVQMGSVPARVAQLVLLDVLYQEYCYRNKESSEENMKRIAAALSEKHI